MGQEASSTGKHYQVKLGTEEYLESKDVINALDSQLIPDLGKIVYDYCQTTLPLYLITSPPSKFSQVEVLNDRMIEDEKVISQATPGTKREVYSLCKSGDYVLISYSEKIANRQVGNRLYYSDPVHYTEKYHIPTGIITKLDGCGSYGMGVDQNGKLYHAIGNRIEEYINNWWNKVDAIKDIYTDYSNHITHASTKNGIYTFKYDIGVLLFFDFKTRKYTKRKSQAINKCCALTVSDDCILLISNTHILEYRPHEDGYSYLTTDMKLPVDINIHRPYFAYHLGILYMIKPKHMAEDSCLYYLKAPFNTWQGPVENFPKDVLIAC